MDGGGLLGVRLVERTPNDHWVSRDHAGIVAAAGRVAEIGIPFSSLHVGAHAAVAFFVTLGRDGVEVEHHPKHRPIEVTVPDASFPALNWTA